MVSTNQELEVDYHVQTLIIGDCRVGKSTMIQCFCEGDYVKGQKCSSGIGKKYKAFHHMNKFIKMSFWDTSGNTKLRELATPFFKKVQGIFLVYDVCNEASFKSLDYWMQKIKENAQEHCQIVCIGHKIDRINEIEVDEVRALKFC